MKNFGGTLARLVCLTLAAFTVQSAVLAQTSEVNLRGQVTDESGAVVPAIAVTVEGPGGVSHEAKTGTDGRYSFSDLPAGSYTLRIQLKGFADFEKSGITIVRGQLQTADAQLVVVMEEQKVTVREEGAPEVSVGSSSNAGALVLSSAEDLQALSDDPTELQADLQALAGPSAGPSGGAIYVNGFSNGSLPAKESIREIRINQNPFSPEYDKLGYGRIEIFTKPGTEKFHGTFDSNTADQVWNSRNPYSAQKAPFFLQELEGNLGGPLTKRSSFAFEYQRNMVNNGSIVNAVTLDPVTFATVPFNEVHTAVQRFTRLNPRMDYQLNDKHTLVFAYDFTHSNIRDAGIGAFDLISRGYHVQYTDQTFQLTETAVLGTSVNETRFQYYRTAMQTLPNDFSPEIHVSGSFNGGGTQKGQSTDTWNDFEIQNYTSMIRNHHTWRFGVRLRAQFDNSAARQDFNGVFTFAGGLVPQPYATNCPFSNSSASISSIERYRRTLLMQSSTSPTYTPLQIRACGGGAEQFSIDTGIPGLVTRQGDIGVFGGDEWAIRPNLTFNFGLRYETQSNIHDWRDFAPRLAVAWAPGGGNSGRRAKTVLRAGFGMFYDRFALSDILTAERYNGVLQQQFVVQNPDFFPTTPTASSLASLGFQQIQLLSPVARAPYVLQSAVAVERQLTQSTTFALTYTNTHGLHEFRSEDINPPLPGTFDPNVPGSGTYPPGHQPGPVFLMESTGIYNQNQLVANVNTKLNGGLSLFGFYVLNHAMSNTDGINTFPANPYSILGEYGPASNDVRHRATVGGSISTKWNVRISPFVVIQSGAPFDITTGSDLFGTTLFNSRPGIATDPNRPGVIQTAYGLLDPNPSPSEQILHRNDGRGPALIRVNLRIGKAIGFGSETKRSAEKGPTIGSGTGSASQASGRGIGGILGAPKASRRYNLILSMSIQNLLNHTNPGPIIGDITSPLFGFANQAAGGPNGEGFFETANNRRLEAQARFTF